MHHVRVQGDTGSIIAGWLFKVALVISVLGICVFDGISIGTTYTSTSDAGNSAARAGSEEWIGDGKDIQKAYDAAVHDANDNGDDYVIDPKTFSVDPDGTVHLTISKTASTIVVRRIGPIRSWAHIVHQSSGRYIG